MHHGGWSKGRARSLIRRIVFPDKIKDQKSGGRRRSAHMGTVLQFGWDLGDCKKIQMRKMLLEPKEKTFFFGSRSFYEGNEYVPVQFEIEQDTNNIKIYAILKLDPTHYICIRVVRLLTETRSNFNFNGKIYSSIATTYGQENKTIQWTLSFLTIYLLILIAPDV